MKKAISCFALTTENDNCVTAGTWAGYIQHYDLRAPKLGPLFTLSGHDGGITWLKYTVTQDNSWYLFSGARKDKKILQWDMRNYTEPLQIFERNVDTNQRIYYDLTPLNTWLASGDTQGLLRVWNLGNKSDHFEVIRNIIIFILQTVLIFFFHFSYLYIRIVVMALVSILHYP